MSNFFTKVGKFFFDVLPIIAIIFTFGLVAAYVSTLEPKKSEPLKEFKDGIQNHLVWDIKGQCYFVRPNDEVTVYLIRVVDCDKK